MGGDDDQSDHEDRDDHQSEHSDQDQVDNEGGRKIKTKLATQTRYLSINTNCSVSIVWYPYAQTGRYDDIILLDLLSEQ